MIWILSILLCVFLLATTMAIFMPELVIPLIANRWRRKSYYSRH